MLEDRSPTGGCPACHPLNGPSAFTVSAPGLSSIHERSNLDSINEALNLIAEIRDGTQVASPYPAYGVAGLHRRPPALAVEVEEEAEEEE